MQPEPLDKDDAAIEPIATLVRAAGLGVIRQITPVRAHASARKIYRCHLEDGQGVIGVYHQDLRENKAFTAFAQSFRSIGLSVPQIIASDDHGAYLLTDLGDVTLYDLVTSDERGNEIPPLVLGYYRQAVEDLVRFQIDGLKVIDTGLCTEGKKFDQQAILGDFKYFSQEYLARAGFFEISEETLSDVRQLAAFCGDYQPGFFMYRDFQARNIMVQDGRLIYIDFQSGREGPLQYDLASLLYQSQADLSPDVRGDLIEHYLGAATKAVKIDAVAFKAQFSMFALVRVIQTLGAYGRFGLGDRKPYFLSAIPFAKKNITTILEGWPEGLPLFSLRSLLETVINQSGDESAL